MSTPATTFSTPHKQTYSLRALAVLRTTPTRQEASGQEAAHSRKGRRLHCLVDTQRTILGMLASRSGQRVGHQHDHARTQSSVCVSFPPHRRSRVHMHARTHALPSIARLPMMKRWSTQDLLWFAARAHCVCVRHSFLHTHARFHDVHTRSRPHSFSTPGTCRTDVLTAFQSSTVQWTTGVFKILFGNAGTGSKGEATEWYASNQPKVILGKVSSVHRQAKPTC
jgi:hypothetical protein